MNKADICLIIIITALTLLISLSFKSIFKKDVTKAVVYYENKVILTIDLTINEYKEYEVEGYNGILKIVAGKGKIKVISENSPLHLCSKQGFIDKTYETIICLPNKIVIKLDGISDIDTVVR